MEYFNAQGQRITKEEWEVVGESESGGGAGAGDVAGICQEGGRSSTAEEMKDNAVVADVLPSYIDTCGRFGQ